MDKLLSSNLAFVGIDASPDTFVAPNTEATSALRHAGGFVTLLLAIMATSTSLGIAALSGWQRGGALSEQLGCIALAVCSALGTHLLPALCRENDLAVRSAAAALWAAGMIVVLYGQTSFFLLAQQHAGERRVEAVQESTIVLTRDDHQARDLVAIAQQQLKSRTALAAIDSRRCTDDCAGLRMRRDVLGAKLDALAIEANEAKRVEAAEDRQLEQAQGTMRMRDALRDDPVTVRLAAWLGVETGRVDLVLALICACSLDGIGSLCWYVALQGYRREPDETTSYVATVDGARCSDHAVEATTGEYFGETDPDRHRDARLAQLMRDVADGTVRPTVAGIRSHLGCAQETAAKLRRELLVLGAVYVRSNGGHHARK